MGEQPDFGRQNQRESGEKNQTSMYNFSPEEERVLRECNRESFFKRCLPLGTSFGIATHFAVKKGYLTASPKYGSLPKTFVAVVSGYILGKVIYQPECMQKLMQLPDSRIGQMLRKRMNVPDYKESSELPFEESFVSTNAPQGSDDVSNSSLNMDENRPSFTTLDESLYRSTVDSYTPKDDIPAYRPPTLSYDDLRKMHRDESQNRYQAYRNDDPQRATMQRDSKKKNNDTMFE